MPFQPTDPTDQLALDSFRCVLYSGHFLASDQNFWLALASTGRLEVAQVVQHNSAALCAHCGPFSGNAPGESVRRGWTCLTDGRFDGIT